MEITTGSRIWLRRRGARPLVLVVSEVIGGSLVARDAPHAVGRFCAYLVIDPATAETDAKGRTTYRPAEGTRVYTARHAAVEAAGSLGAETCPACGRVSPTATPGLCGPCGIAADLAAVAREIATEPDDAELMAAWQDTVEPTHSDAWEGFGATPSSEDFEAYGFRAA